MWKRGSAHVYIIIIASSLLFSTVLYHRRKTSATLIAVMNFCLKVLQCYSIQRPRAHSPPSKNSCSLLFSFIRFRKITIGFFFPHFTHYIHRLRRPCSNLATFSKIQCMPTIESLLQNNIMCIPLRIPLLYTSSRNTS